MAYQVARVTKWPMANSSTARKFDHSRMRMDSNKQQKSCDRHTRRHLKRMKEYKSLEKKSKQESVERTESV